MTPWLVFLNDAASTRWVQVAGDMVVARGNDLASIPHEGTEAVAVTVIVPGTEVVVHWVDLPALAPAQALAAAHMLAADVCGGATTATHVALGDIGDDGSRPMVLVEKQVMQGWLDTLAAAGLVAARIVPLPLLLPAPTGSADAAVVLDDGELVHARGHRLAFSAEPPLAALMLANAPMQPLAPADFETGLSAAVSRAPIDLRQGEFAPKRQSAVDRYQLRRIALTALATAMLWVGTQGAALLRDNLAADRIDRQAADAARAVLPRGTAIDAPRVQVMALGERLGTGGQGFTALAVPVLTVLRDRSAITLQSLRYSPDTGLVAVLAVASDDDRQALAAGLAATDIVASVGAPRDDSGTSLVDVMVRPK